jgi:hypothetical protein
MRRKLAPIPLKRSEISRPLVAAVVRAALPTAAALALALAGCSGVEPETAISADKVTTKVAPVPSVEPSASASSTPAIDPTPIPLPGEAMIVVPPPPIASVAAPTPSTKPHKTAGKPAPVHPTI